MEPKTDRVARLTPKRANRKSAAIECEFLNVGRRPRIGNRSDNDSSTTVVQRVRYLMHSLGMFEHNLQAKFIDQAIGIANIIFVMNVDANGNLTFDCPQQQFFGRFAFGWFFASVLLRRVKLASDLLKLCRSRESRGRGRGCGGLGRLLHRESAATSHELIRKIRCSGWRGRRHTQLDLQACRRSKRQFAGPIAGTDSKNRSTPTQIAAGGRLNVELR